MACKSKCMQCAYLNLHLCGRLFRTLCRCGSWTSAAAEWVSTISRSSKSCGVGQELACMVMHGMQGYMLTLQFYKIYSRMCTCSRVHACSCAKAPKLGLQRGPKRGSLNLPCRTQRSKDIDKTHVMMDRVLG